jgi:hypothetical protein
MKNALTLVLSLFCVFNAGSQTSATYPDIPRIDVHTHVSDDYQAIEKYLELREVLQADHSIDLAMWINLGDRNKPIGNIDSVLIASEHRMLCAFGDYEAARGLNYQPEDLESERQKGFIGYKIWYGPYYRRLEPGEKGFPYADDPAHEPVFAKMEEMGMLAASFHIADPNGPYGNRTKWCADPVEYWKEITSFHRFLEKHPDLHIVAAHGAWLVCQDAQLDYLRFLLYTFPNFNIDLAATFQYFDLVSHDNLRAFMMDYADRIVFGTDIGRWYTPEETRNRATAYSRCFQILESDLVVNGGFFGDKPIRGLNLPREVLEKIYYKNAIRIYPDLYSSFKALGYNVD